jgi:Fe-S cluster assembly scaffold protein SufB
VDARKASGKSESVSRKSDADLGTGSLKTRSLKNLLLRTARVSFKYAQSWDDVPDTIKNTFERLGIPEAERTMLAGVGAQYDSEVVYHNLRQELRDQWVIFEDMSIAVREHAKLVQKYFMKLDSCEWPYICCICMVLYGLVGLFSMCHGG